MKPSALNQCETQGVPARVKLQHIVCLASLVRIVLNKEYWDLTGKKNIPFGTSAALDICFLYFAFH